MRFTTLVFLGLLIMVFMAVPGMTFEDKADRVKKVSKHHLGVTKLPHYFISGLETIHHGGEVIITKLKVLHSRSIR